LRNASQGEEKPGPTERSYIYYTTSFEPNYTMKGDSSDAKDYPEEFIRAVMFLVYSKITRACLSPRLPVLLSLQSFFG
jgi:hypothetical protein